MNARELRIGNWITIYGVPNQVKGDWIANIDHANVSGKTMLDDPSPIPLTEEWLERFGFERHHKRAYEFWKFERFIVYSRSDGGFLFEIMVGLEDGWTKDVNYVHELQNRIFALTGEELELKK
jgi:hypothetical protein